MGAFVITIFIMQIVRVGAKLAYVGKNEYPRVLKIDVGAEWVGILISAALAIWAGVLIF